MVFHCMNMPQFSSPVLYCGFWTFTFANEILQRITMYVKSFHKYQLIISLLQNNQDNSVPGNEVTRECHGKLSWLKSTPSVQNLSLDVNALQFRHFHYAHWSSEFMWSLQLCQKLDTHRDYLLQARKPRESPHICEETNDLVMVDLEFFLCSVEELMHYWYLFLSLSFLSSWRRCNSVMFYLKTYLPGCLMRGIFFFFSNSQRHKVTWHTEIYWMGLSTSLNLSQSSERHPYNKLKGMVICLKYLYLYIHMWYVQCLPKSTTRKCSCMWGIEIF